MLLIGVLICSVEQYGSSASEYKYLSSAFLFVSIHRGLPLGGAIFLGG